MAKKLADALLRRKELQNKVAQLHVIKESDMTEMKFTRKSVSDTIDDIAAKVPKLTASQVTQEYDYYAGQLRKIDAAIQQRNWTVDIDVEESVWASYQVPAQAVNQPANQFNQPDDWQPAI